MSMPIVSADSRYYLHRRYRFAAGPVNGAMYDLETAQVHRMVGRMRGWLSGILATGQRPADMPDTVWSWLGGSGYLTTVPGDAAADPWLQAAPASQRKMVWIELTEQCNYRCVHCYAESGPELKGGLPDHDILALVDEVAALGFPAIQFTGGDPTVHKRFMQFVERAHQRGIGYVEVYTNGANLRRAWLEQFKAWGTHLAISFYSAEPEVYESITATPGSFQRAVNNIQMAVGMGVPVRIGLVLMRENAGHEASARAFLQGLGVSADKIHADQVRPTGRGDGALIHAVSPYGQPDSTVIPIAALRNYTEATEAEAVSARRDSFPWAFYQLPTRFRPVQEQAQMNACWSGELVVAPSGQVFPCIFARSQPMGDVTQAPLTQIIASEPVTAIWGHDLRDSEDCSVCEFRFACFDCRALTLSTTGRMLAKPPGCRYDPRTGHLELHPEWRAIGPWLDFAPRLRTDLQLEGGYILSPEGRVFGLDPLGEALLAELDGSRTVAELVAAIQAHYSDTGVDPLRIRHDVVGFVRALAEGGLLQNQAAGLEVVVGQVSGDGASSLGIAPDA